MAALPSLRQLQYLVKLAELRNFTRAAAACHVRGAYSPCPCQWLWLCQCLCLCLWLWHGHFTRLYVGLPIRAAPVPDVSPCRSYCEHLLLLF